MKALTARDALTESYLCVSSDGHPREFLNQVKDENVQACAVFENSTFLGLVDFKDILTCNPQRIFADLLPEPQAPPVQDDTPVQEVSRLLDRYRGNALPVLDKKSSFIGVISRDSLLYVLLQKHQHLLKLTKNVKDIVQTVNAVLDLKSMLRVALRKTLEMMGLKTGWLFLYNEEASMARLVTHVNLPRKYLKDHHALLRESCLCQSEVLNKKNEATVLCLKCVRGEKVTSDLKWHISIPLVSLAKPLGVMNLACRQEPCISNEELNLLTTLGKSIGTAIMNTQSFHKLEAERERLAQWSKRLSQLNKASTHLLSLLGTPILEDRLLQEGIETLCQLVEARYGVVGLFDADGKLVKLVHTGLTQAEAAQLEDLPKGMGILGALDQEQHVVRLRDVKKHPSFSGFPPNHPQMKSFLGMRIALKGKVHGRIYLTDKCGGRSFSKEDEKLVATFANSMALAIEHTHLMENLNRSEQRFRSVAQSASDAIISADSSGYIISWNNGARTIFGYQEEEVLGQPLTLLIPEWDRDAHEKGLKRMTSTGESHVIGKILELEGLRKDGSVFPLELSVATWKTEEGTFYSGIIRDITKRKQAEEVLRQTNERLNLTLDNLTIVAFEINSEGRWLLSRGKGLEKIGRRPDDVLGQSIFDYYKDEPVITEAVRKALGGQRQQIEVEMDGLVWAANYTPVAGPSGKIERVYGTAIDITERKRAEEVLKARALQQSVVTEFGQYALQGTDLFRLMDKAVHLVAQTLDVEYCKVLELLPGDEALLLRAGVGWKDGYVGRATVGAGIDSQAGYTLLSKEPVIVEDLRAEKRFSGPQLLHDHNVVSGMSVVIAGKKRPFGVLGTHTTRKRLFTNHDIHFLQSIANVLATAIERRKLEEQLRQAQRLEAVGELTGGIAHDFNNLLMVILGNAEFGLQDCAPGDPVYSDLAKIETAATQARDLVSQLLSFSRQKEINPKNLNLNQAIEQFLTMLNRIIGENIEVKLSLAPDLLPVRADPVHVHQLLMNICLNARDAMPQGGTLTIESTNRTGDGVEGLPQLQTESRNFVQLTITDTGHGMDNEEQSRIFEPFFTTKGLGKGTGLGLSVVYGIVKQHDGHIEVSSEKGKGTAFKIYLPAVQEGESDEKRKKRVSNQTVGAKTILLVDDDEAVRNVTIRILQGLGYAVHIAQNEKEAMKIFETQYQDFDLVILDVVLPESSGLEVYEKMQSIKPNLSVLFVTGYDLKTILDELKHLEQKKTRILQKPFKKETLGKTVRDLIN